VALISFTSNSDIKTNSKVPSVWSYCGPLCDSAIMFRRFVMWQGNCSPLLIGGWIPLPTTEKVMGL